MELVKDIFFNTDKLLENTNVRVSYTGKFFQENNEKVFLHYGYDQDWNNLNDIEMTKTDLGYQAELDLLGKDTINFCFKNQNNEWDNNLGKDYVFNIEKNIQPVVEFKESVDVLLDTKLNNVTTETPQTSIALAPTGFDYWTKKVKASVCKFFSYVPKFISGNFKRNLADNSNNNNN